MIGRNGSETGFPPQQPATPGKTERKSASIFSQSLHENCSKALKMIINSNFQIEIIHPLTTG
jgi:hypothetical protein